MEYNQAIVDQALLKAKKWQAGEDEKVNSIVARVKKEVMNKIVSYGNRFKRSAFFLIRKKILRPRLFRYRFYNDGRP